MYRLVLTRFEPNPNYEKEMADYHAREGERTKRQMSGYYSHNDMPDQLPYPAAFVDSRKLEVEVTDDEYAAIKKAVLELS